MTISQQEALTRLIEHREIFHDEMLYLFRKIMGGEMSPLMIAALTIGLRVKKASVKSPQRHKSCANSRPKCHWSIPKI
jgi:anthranilate phosphoribosyltransferase